MPGAISDSGAISGLAGSRVRTSVIAAVVALGMVFVGGRWFLERELATLERPLSLESGDLHLVVTPGTTLSEVSGDLGQQGILENPRSLVWYARWNELAHQIKAGEYAIPTGTTALELLALLIEGKVVQWSFTIVEGWTFRQLREHLARNGNLVHTLSELDEDAVMTKLGHPGIKPEGWFLPDTYHFPKGTTDVEFLRRALNATQRNLNTEWEKRDPDLPYLKPYDALIMASIVERETGAAFERPKIAGVFVRRLRKGMRLEADPTVIYGLGEEFDGDITHAHLKQPTPYNTYVRRGLPPTPIAMPSAAAVHAALHPEPGKELFFVAKGDGTHYFSATYAEHEQAVQEYQVKPKKGSTAMKRDG